MLAAPFKPIAGELLRTVRISLPNGIKGQEYRIEGYPHVVGSNAITWRSGQWSYFVTAEPGEGVFSTVDYAHQIINDVGTSGQALPGLPGRFYVYGDSADSLPTDIYWEINDSTWYYFSWSHGFSEAIQILRSMAYVGGGDVK